MIIRLEILGLLIAHIIFILVDDKVLWSIIIGMGIRDIVRIQEMPHLGNCRLVSFILEREDYGRFVKWALELQHTAANDPLYEWNDYCLTWDSRCHYSIGNRFAVDLEVVWSDLEHVLTILSRFNPRKDPYWV